MMAGKVLRSDSDKHRPSRGLKAINSVCVAILGRLDTASPGNQ
jgi:hypothetical protein